MASVAGLEGSMRAILQSNSTLLMCSPSYQTLTFATINNAGTLKARAAKLVKEQAEQASKAAKSEARHRARMEAEDAKSKRNLQDGVVPNRENWGR
jgi:hypothetical protein